MAGLIWWNMMSAKVEASMGWWEMAARSMATRRARSGNVSRRPPGPLAASNFQARIRSTIGELSTTPVTFCTTASAKGRVPGASATISAPSPTSPGTSTAIVIGHPSHEGAAGPWRDRPGR